MFADASVGCNASFLTNYYDEEDEDQPCPVTLDDDHIKGGLNGTEVITFDGELDQGYTYAVFVADYESMEGNPGGLPVSGAAATFYGPGGQIKRVALEDAAGPPPTEDTV